jgi:8-oxo-dGTP pyrophosphatase MutT (NUDIX family)
MAERPPIAPHQLTTNVKLLQKAVLIHRGEVLLLQREPNDQSRPNCWDTPGGNSEWPEQTAQPQSNPHLADICREIEEESSIVLDPATLNHDSLVYHETYYEPAREIFTVLFGWRIELPDEFNRSQVDISEEHQGAQWVTPQQAQDFDFGGPKGEFMKKIIAAATAHL